MKHIYLLKYITNTSDNIKYKAFETYELAEKFHLGYKKMVTTFSYPEAELYFKNINKREIIHYEILVIPVNLGLNNE